MKGSSGHRQKAAKRRLHGLLLVAAPSVVLFMGCGMSDDPVKDRWDGRNKLPSCGNVNLAQGETLETSAHHEIACLRQALKSRQGTELMVTAPTVEGDPIRTYYRLTTQSTLEVYVDSTDDPYSDQRWSFSDCYTPEWLPELSCN